MDDKQPRDLRSGIPIRELTDGAMVSGVVDGEDAVVLRAGDDLYAVGGQCTHYHARLCEGLLTGTVLRCPMHHARFDVRTGEALCAPALDALPCWRVERVGDQAVVRERIAVSAKKTSSGASPRRIVIVSRDDPAQPEYAATLSWNLSPRLSASNFAFRPDREARPIALAGVAEARS